MTRTVQYTYRPHTVLDAIMLGSPLPFGEGNGRVHIEIDNLDPDIEANWGLKQIWFDNGLARKDSMLVLGYNFDEETGGRKDPTEPAFGLQLESYDVAADEVTPLVAFGMTLIGTDGLVRRSEYASVVRSTWSIDVSHLTRNRLFASMDGSTMLHIAENGPNVGVGVGTIANGNNNGLHVKGTTLWENPNGTADDTWWDWTWSGDSAVFGCVNDAYDTRNIVARFDRAGGVPSIAYWFAKLGIGSSGDAFLWRTSSSVVTLDSDSVGTCNNRLKLGTIDIQTAGTTGASTATMTNSPTAGNPTTWAPVYYQGALKRMPLWG